MAKVPTHLHTGGGASDRSRDTGGEVPGRCKNWQWMSGETLIQTFPRGQCHHYGHILEVTTTNLNKTRGLHTQVFLQPFKSPSPPGRFWAACSSEPQPRWRGTQESLTNPSSCCKQSKSSSTQRHENRSCLSSLDLRFGKRRAVLTPDTCLNSPLETCKQR